MKAAEENGRIAAICAAPTVLGKLGLLNGRKAICYPGMEDGLTGAEVTVEPVVTDGNITTQRSWHCDSVCASPYRGTLRKRDGGQDRQEYCLSGIRRADEGNVEPDRF